MEGGVHSDPFKNAYSIKCLRNAPDLCMRTAKVLASVCEQQSVLPVLRAAKRVASFGSVASSKASCECCQQQRFLLVFRAAKLLASDCEQQRLLPV